MKLYATIANEHKKFVKIGGNTAIELIAHVGNKIVGTVVLLEGSLALYDTMGRLKGEIQQGKKLGMSDRVDEREIDYDIEQEQKGKKQKGDEIIQEGF